MATTDNNELAYQLVHPSFYCCRSRVDVSKGRFVKVAVNHEVVQLLSEKGNCVDGFPGNAKNYDGCIYSRMGELMNEKVGCTVPWLLNQSNICTEEAKRKKAFEIYQANRRNQKDICPMSCLFTNMYFGPPVTGKHTREDRSWGVFYFRRDIKTTSEYFLYSILSMAAEIGAYVGLLLGASLVNMGGIHNTIIDFFWKGDDSENLTESIQPNVKMIHPPKIEPVGTQHF